MNATDDRLRHYPYGAVAEMRKERQSKPALETIKIHAWKVTIYQGWAEERTFLFRNEGLAKLGAEWAFQNRLAEIQGREDASNIEVCRSGHFVAGEGRLGIKLVWAKQTPTGFAYVKEYFYAEPISLEYNILG